jgi:serine/threonine protein kinase
MACNSANSPWTWQSDTPMAHALTHIGAYKVLHEIASGGFGTVYLAEKDGEQFAIKKLVRHNFSTDVSERFFREALHVEEFRDTFKIDFLIRIVDILFKDNAYVMEYIPLGSLEYFFSEKDERFIYNLIYAVSQLHRASVAHRDLKPSNIRVKNGKPVLLDFGVSSWWDSKSHLIPVGTRYYSPPEIVCMFDEFKHCTAAQKASRRLVEIFPENTRERLKHIKKIHDVYSLGMTIGELYHNRLPFERDSYLAYLESGHSAELDRWIAGIPQPVRAFVEKALLFSPLERPLLDHLIERLHIEADTEGMTLPLIEQDAFLDENTYHCLDCDRDVPPPANYCPYCGVELSAMALTLAPEQPVKAHHLPLSLQLYKLARLNQGNTSLVVSMNADNFDIVVGRDPFLAQIALVDDNWLSKAHGRLIKEGRRLFYQEGIKGKVPTNPGFINNVPIGAARCELVSGSFLQIGSTILHVGKYFGNIRLGAQRVGVA